MCIRDSQVSYIAMKQIQAIYREEGKLKDLTSNAVSYTHLHPTEPRVPTGCPYKERCSRAKGNKRLYISKSFLEKRQESYENIPVSYTHLDVYKRQL